jgi:cell division protein FtsN
LPSTPVPAARPRVEPPKPARTASAETTPSTAPDVTAPAKPKRGRPPKVAAAPKAAASATPARDPAAILSAREGSTVKPTPAADPFNYFVQAGAFARPEDAEQQRARLAMMGYEAKVTEREQSGRTVYRVRIGPFPAKDSADGAKDKLAAAGVESALVRVQK